MENRNYSEELKKLIDDYGLITVNDYSNIKLTKKSVIYGYCTNENCENTFDKKNVYIITLKKYIMCKL